MLRKHLILILICTLGSLFHMYFLSLNEVLKIADSFAYLQMSYFLQNLSQQGLGNGWFGFIYSIPLAIAGLFTDREILSAHIVNIILLNITAILTWQLSRKILSKSYSYLVIILLFLSPTLLHFNIHILSENIYIPLFLGTFLLVISFIEKLEGASTIQNIQRIIAIACMIGLMYLTRAEAFIYLLSIGIISTILLTKKKFSIGKFLTLGGVFFISFFIFISPYLFHLHSLTGEWGLTNKGASNLRQAELRGQERMDDEGFERAVAELTDDKHHLIAGFAGGMLYDRPSIEGSLGEFISKDPFAFASRVLTNQKKLFTQNFPEIFLGKSPGLYFSDDTRFSNIIFLLWSIFPLGVLLFGVIKIYQAQRTFFIISTSFLVPAIFFFTLFFTLNRYFLIFLPLLLIIYVYGVEKLSKYKNIMGSALVSYFLMLNILGIFLLSVFVYQNIESPKDEYYSLKKEAGIWLSENNKFGKNITLMERFPIVTYYSGSKTRYITPYSENIRDIYKYGKYNSIDILVVDSMDFKTYRPKLQKYLEETPEGFIKLKEFQNTEGQKVILYELKK